MSSLDERISFDVVAIAASVGGLAALGAVLGGLSADFAAAIAVVQHRSPTESAWLAQILNEGTTLAVKDAEDGDRLRPGTVLIAPAGKHLLINADGSVSLSRSGKVQFARPSADVLFESAAVSLRDRLIAVVLTGGVGDGAEGSRAVKRMGGRVIAQDAATSKSFSMPRSAIETGSVDAVLPLGEIVGTLVRWVRKDWSPSMTGSV